MYDLPTELEDWLKNYTGEGGVSGATSEGIFDEYYTPIPLTKAIWNLVKKYSNPMTIDKDSGYKIFEPSAGIGRF